MAAVTNRIEPGPRWGRMTTSTPGTYPRSWPGCGRSARGNRAPGRRAEQLGVPGSHALDQQPEPVLEAGVASRRARPIDAGDGRPEVGQGRGLLQRPGVALGVGGPGLLGLALNGAADHVVADRQ